MDPVTATNFATIATPIIQGVANVGSGLFGWLNQRSVNKANFKMAEWQNARNIENWQMQNEYNSPLNQMERLKEAGLNPNLVYGQGSVVGNSASSPSPASAPRMEAYQMPQNMLGDLGSIMPALVQLQNMEKTREEIKNIKEVTNLTRQQVEGTRLKNLLMAFENEKNEERKQYLSSMIYYEYALQGLQLDDLQSIIDFRNGPQTANVEADIAYKTAQTLATPILAAAQKVNAEANRKNADTNAYNAQTNRYNAETNRYNAQTTRLMYDLEKTLKDSKVKLTDKQIEEVTARILLLGEQYQGQINANQIHTIITNMGVNPSETGLTGLVNKLLYRIITFKK